MDVNEMKSGLERIFKNIVEGSNPIRYNSLVQDRTVLVVIDMVNGFINEGLLISSRVAAIAPEVINIVKNCKEIGIPVVAFVDSHPEKCPEFEVYGVHCQEGSRECEIIDELKAIGGYIVIKKSSSNGFLEPKFQQWLKSHPSITDYVVIGGCTDICILQFCLTLKAHFNRLNRESQIVVPINAVDTYDFGLHQGDLSHIMALNNLSQNGIKVVTGIL